MIFTHAEDDPGTCNGMFAALGRGGWSLEEFVGRRVLRTGMLVRVWRGQDVAV